MSNFSGPLREHIAGKIIAASSTNCSTSLSVVSIKSVALRARRMTFPLVKPDN